VIGNGTQIYDDSVGAGDLICVIRRPHKDGSFAEKEERVG